MPSGWPSVASHVRVLVVTLHLGVELVVHVRKVLGVLVVGLVGIVLKVFVLVGGLSDVFRDLVKGLVLVVGLFSDGCEGEIRCSSLNELFLFKRETSASEK